MWLLFPPFLFFTPYVFGGVSSRFWAFRNKGSSKTRLKQFRKFSAAAKKNTYLLASLFGFFHGAPRWVPSLSTAPTFICSSTGSPKQPSRAQVATTHLVDPSKAKGAAKAKAKALLYAAFGAARQPGTLSQRSCSHASPSQAPQRSSPRQAQTLPASPTTPGLRSNDT
jgi:hypothetical protein